VTRKCGTCQHIKRAEIDRRLAAGEPGSQIARDCSHAEWAASRALAERHAGRWRKKLYVEDIEIPDAIQV
jgi:hypothetical protein